MEIFGEYDLVVAMDGESALEAAEEEPPELILLDILIPDINGFEVCKRLKHIPETATVPVIFLSA
jgi:DNA-binding response OmpR family regulator